MKICLTDSYLFKNLRGETKHLVLLANGLSEKGYDVTLLIPFTKKYKIKDFLYPNIKVKYLFHYSHTKETLFLSYFFIFLFFRYDYIITCSCFAANVSLTLLQKKLKLKKIKHIILLNMPYEQNFPIFLKLYRRLITNDVFKFAYKIITLSNYIKNSLNAELNKYKKKVITIYPGINAEHYKFKKNFRKKWREHLKISKNTMVFLTVSALENRKNIPSFFAILKEYEKYNKDFVYIVAGTGKIWQQNFIKEKGKKYDILEKLIIINEIKNINEIYSVADVFILLSNYEGFGLVNLEAAATGLPIITPNIPPFPEYITAEMGYTIDIRNKQKFINLLIFLSQKKNRKYFYKSAPESVMLKFNIDLYIENFINSALES